MSGLKIAVIGGGSTYTPELVSTISADDEGLRVRELVLHDIDPERREVVGGARRENALEAGLRGNPRADRTSWTRR